MQYSIALFSLSVIQADCRGKVHTNDRNRSYDENNPDLAMNLSTKMGYKSVEFLCVCVCY